MAYTWTIRTSGFPSGCVECGRSVGVGQPIAWHRLIGGTQCVACAKTLWTAEIGIDWPRIERTWIAKHLDYEVERPRVVAGACPRCGAPAGTELHTFLRRHRCGGEPEVCGACGYPVGSCRGCGEAIATGAVWEHRAEREGEVAFARTLCRHYHPGHQLLADKRQAAERAALERYESEIREPRPRQLPVRTYQLEQRRGGRGRYRNDWRAVDVDYLAVFRGRAVTGVGAALHRVEAANRLARMRQMARADPRNVRLIRKSIA